MVMMFVGVGVAVLIVDGTVRTIFKRRKPLEREIFIPARKFFVTTQTQIGVKLF
jgi:hypothetical protein